MTSRSAQLDRRPGLPAGLLAELVGVLPAHADALPALERDAPRAKPAAPARLEGPGDGGAQRRGAADHRPPVRRLRRALRGGPGASRRDGIAYRSSPASCAVSTTTRGPRSSSSARREGQQSALGGGGRYDGLVELLGGRPTPGIGFALGLDRVVLALEAQDASAARPEAAAGGRRRGRSRGHRGAPARRHRAPRGRAPRSGPSSASASSAGSSRRRPATAPTSRSSWATSRHGQVQLRDLQAGSQRRRSDRRSRAGAAAEPTKRISTADLCGGHAGGALVGRGSLRLRYAGHDRPTDADLLATPYRTHTAASCAPPTPGRPRGCPAGSIVGAITAS